MEIRFRARNYIEYAYDVPPVTFTVGPYSHHAIGGPLQAQISATGAPDDLLRLLAMLRYPVEIYNDAGNAVWWGYLHSATVEIGNRVYSATLDEMYNRVAVAYTTATAGQSSTGLRATTEWVEDSVSVAEYGRRAILESINNTTAQLAQASRDYTLAQRSRPVARVRLARTSVPAPRATLNCLGWWSTLEWVYCNVPTMIITHYSYTNGAVQTVGMDYTDDAQNVVRLGQSFKIGATAIDVAQLAVHVRRVGTPSGGLKLEICANTNADGLTPGSSLASTTISPGDIPTTADWVRGTLSSTLQLAANTSYYLVASTTNVSGSNYYVVSLDTTRGYSDGVLRQYVSAWAAPSVAADMPFQLFTNALVDLLAQARAIIVAHGQFLGQVYVHVSSGYASESYRNGDSDALYEVEELLRPPTTAGQRVLARVDQYRNIWLTAADASTPTLWTLSERNELVYNGGAVDPSTCPVGVWATVEGAPVTMDGQVLGGLERFFVEQTEYDPATGKLSYETSETSNPYDFGGQPG